jgi:pimeloyl-ACP methyl ester carboxylesterase
MRPFSLIGNSLPFSLQQREKLVMNTHEPFHLFDPLFTTARVRSIFSDCERLQNMLGFEAVLARAESRAGITPSGAAEAICVLRILETANADGYIASCMAVRDFDARAEIVQIRTPTLVITGAQDPAATPADGRFLAQSIPGARYAELNAAHLCNIEDREPFRSGAHNFFCA